VIQIAFRKKLLKKKLLGENITDGTGENITDETVITQIRIYF
jgi:hypothetical protein